MRASVFLYFYLCVLLTHVLLAGGCGIPGEDDSYDFGSAAGFYLNATTEGYKEQYHMYDYVTKACGLSMTGCIMMS